MDYNMPNAYDQLYDGDPNSSDILNQFSVSQNGSDTLNNFDVNDSSLSIGGQELTPEQRQQRDILIGVRLFVCVLGVIGNALVIFVVFTLKEYKKTVAHWYVLQLAIADLIFLLTIPFKVSEDLNDEWIYTGGMCKAKEAILFLNYYSSVFFLIVMSIDRYIAVCHSFSVKLGKFRKKRAAYIVTVVIWTVSLMLCTPIFMYSDKRGRDPHCKCAFEFPEVGGGKSIEEECREITDTEQHFNSCMAVSTNEACVKDLSETEFNAAVYSLSGNLTSSEESDFDFSDYDYGESMQSSGFEGSGALNLSHQYEDGCSYADFSPTWKQYLTVNFIIAFVIPFLIMSVCYTLIALKLKESGRRRSSTTGDRAKRSAATKKSDSDRKRVTFICLLLVVLFVCCWLPFHSVHLAKFKGISGTTEYCLRVSAITTVIAYLNSALNPYVYNFIGNKFGKKLRSAAGTIKMSVKESSMSRSEDHVQYRKRKRQYQSGTSSNGSATAVTKIHKGRSEASSRAQTSTSEEANSLVKDNATTSKL